MNQSTDAKKSFLVVTKCYFSDKWYVIRKFHDGREEIKEHTTTSFTAALAYKKEHK